MADERDRRDRREPAGFTPRTGGLASVYAREQGWEMNEEQRARSAMEKQRYNGGRDYDYGAQNFGDEPVDRSPAKHRRQGVQR